MAGTAMAEPPATLPALGRHRWWATEQGGPVAQSTRGLAAVRGAGDAPGATGGSCAYEFRGMRDGRTMALVCPLKLAEGTPTHDTGEAAAANDDAGEARREPDAAVAGNVAGKVSARRRGASIAGAACAALALVAVVSIALAVTLSADSTGSSRVAQPGTNATAAANASAADALERAAGDAAATNATAEPTTTVDITPRAHGPIDVVFAQLDFYAADLVGLEAALRGALDAVGVGPFASLEITFRAGSVVATVVPDTDATAELIKDNLGRIRAAVGGSIVVATAAAAAATTEVAIAATAIGPARTTATVISTATMARTNTTTASSMAPTTAPSGPGALLLSPCFWVLRSAGAERFVCGLRLGRARCQLHAHMRGAPMLSTPQTIIFG